MTGRTVAVIGTPGAEPGTVAAGLAALACEDQAVVVDDDEAADVTVLVLDPSVLPGAEEERLLGRLADRGVPTALVLGRAEHHPEWPAVAVAARGRLDSGGRLAFFAVASGGGTDTGVADLAEWCRTVADDESIPELGSDCGPAEPTAVVGESDAVIVGATRADRLNGLRAGAAAARTEVVTAVRESMQALAVGADRACGGATPAAAEGIAAWVTDSVHAVGLRADELLADRLDHVRAVALVGLPGEAVDGGRRVPAVPLEARTAPLPERGPGPEDAVLLLLGASAGLGAGRMLVAPVADLAGLGWAGTALTVVSGLLIAAALVRARRVSATRAALRRWAADTVALSRTALEHRLAAAAGDAEARAGREVWNRTAARSV